MRFLLMIFLVSQGAWAQVSLPRLNIDPKEITVSGVSSGGFMAVQLQIAHSRVLSGAASVAGGVYWCAEGDAQKAQSECMGRPGTKDASVQVAEARRLASVGLIDDLANLKNRKVYIFASPKDLVIHSSNGDRLRSFFSEFVLPENLVVENKVESAHGFPTLETGAPCSIGRSPWLLKCGVDTAGEILKSLYEDLGSRGDFVPNNLKRFSQAPFGDSGTPLFATGWIYIPSVCEAGEKCRLHVALHGCLMNPDFIQDQFARHAGYNEWAEANKMVILYPQSAKLTPLNPYACWDWFGFTGQDYVTRSGAQIKALRAMIDRVSGT